MDFSPHKLEKLLLFEQAFKHLIILKELEKKNVFFDCFSTKNISFLWESIILLKKRVHPLKTSVQVILELNYSKDIITTYPCWRDFLPLCRGSMAICVLENKLTQISFHHHYHKAQVIQSLNGDIQQIIKLLSAIG